MPTSILPTIPYDPNDERPLPEILLEYLGGELLYIDLADGTRLYSVREWVYCVSGSKNKNRSAPWSDLKKSMARHPELKDSEIFRVLEVETAGGKQQTEYADEQGLYAITQRMSDRSETVRAVKNYLAAAGVFVDEVRRDVSTVIGSGAMTPDQAIEAAIAAYRAQGKDDRWIQARIEGKIKRGLFTRALTAAVAEMLTPRHYATATDDIYRGLWDRTAATLRGELGLSRKDSLRDHQPTLALDYQRIAEEICAIQLGEREELTWNEAREIVKMVAEFVGEQAQKTSQLLKMDIATGKPLLNA